MYEKQLQPSNIAKTFYKLVQNTLLTS